MRKQNQASEYTLAREDILRVITAASETTDVHPLRDRTLVALLYWNALRREEAATLDMTDIDWESRSISILGKGGKRRSLPVRPELLSDLKILLQGRAIRPERVSEGRRVRPPSPVFPSQKSLGIDLHSIDPSVVNRILARAAKHAGVKSPNPRMRNVNPHLLRHSFGRHWLDAGGDIRALSWFLGHGSIATTIDIYGTPSQEFIVSEYEKFIEGTLWRSGAQRSGALPNS